MTKSVQRHLWCRLDHDFLHNPLWRLVARMAAAPLTHVRLFVVELELYASANIPRGSLEGLSVPAIAADWMLPQDDQLARIYAALEDPQIGWIDQEQIVSFWTRNPDAEITREQARERKRRERTRNKQLRQAQEPPARPLIHMSRGVTRDIVTVTLQTDKDSSCGAAVENSGAEAGGTAAWLGREAVEIVVRRMNDHPTRAKLRIERWLCALQGEADVLRQILDAVDEKGANGPHFHTLVADAVQRRAEQAAKGPRLPLGPARALTKDGQG